MKFAHEATIAAPMDKVWSFLMDVPSVAKCAPGVEEVEPLGNDRYRGTLKVSVGPIRLSLQGDVYIVERDDAAMKASMRADADATVMGRIGEFGQPIIKKKAEQMMNEFAKNLEKAITEKSG